MHSVVLQDAHEGRSFPKTGRTCDASSKPSHSKLSHLDSGGPLTASGLLYDMARCAFRRCFAAETWRQHFASDPLNRDAGDHLRRNLLQLGGARPPRDLIRGLLGERALVHDSAGGCMPAADSYLAELQSLRTAW